MPDVLEVYEMVTGRKHPDPGALERQQKRQVRTARNQKVGAFVVAAVVVIAAIAAIVAMRVDRNASTPADQPPSVGQVERTAIEVATGFLEALAAGDVAPAVAYLSTDADITDLLGAEGAPGTPEGLPRFMSFLEAVGYRHPRITCEAGDVASSGTTVRCPFDFHFLRSDEIGRGPFTGSSYVLTVRDGAIVRASVHWETEVFSPRMWEPFADWVSREYPDDVVVMYDGLSQTNYRLSEESIRLWKQHSREYVEVVLARATGPG